MGFKGFFDWYHENGILPNIWKGATGQLSQEKLNDENLQYQRERNAIEDSRYEEETAYNRTWAENERDYQRGRDTLADERYQEELNYNRSFAEDERAYQRAFSAEEQSYNRAWAENERDYQRNWSLNQRDYERSLQDKIFEREDTAIARQADALRAQGINPLSQSMNGLGAGSVVSSSSAPSTGYSGTSSGSSSAPSSPGYSGGSSTPAPALSGRQGKALQNAMTTSQGINDLIAPILQTLNTVDNLRGAGTQRDILNANAMQAQAEANMAIMEMFDMSNRLNIPQFSFSYGTNNHKKYSAKNNNYNPYYYSPKDMNKYEMLPKHLDGLITGNQIKTLDSTHDAMTFLTGKLFDFVQTKSGIELNDKIQNSFTSILENLLLNSFKTHASSTKQSNNRKKKK